jgi:hypothetical protein
MDGVLLHASIGAGTHSFVRHLENSGTWLGNRWIEYCQICRAFRISLGPGLDHKGISGSSVHSAMQYLSKNPGIAE